LSQVQLLEWCLAGPQDQAYENDCPATKHVSLFCTGNAGRSTRQSALVFRRNDRILGKMPTQLRWGILGTGNIARQFAAGLNASRRGRPTAVGSRSAEAAREFARSFAISTAHAPYDKLIVDPQVDAVYISLPNSLHCQWTLAALAAGKHVLCEKPLALDSQQARRMFDAAKSSGKILMEAFMYRCHPQTLAVLEALGAGAIGQLQHIRASFCYRARRIEGNVRFVRELGGGSLMDVGCYCTSFIRLLAAAEPVSLQVSGRLHPAGVDDMAAGTMTFAGGIIGSFACGMSLHADNTAYLCGSDGYMEIPVPWKPPAQQAQFVITRGIPPRMDNPNATPGSPPRDVHRVDAGGDLYGVEADDFAATVLDDRPPRIDRAESLGNMLVLDELRRQIGLNFG
jgi:predicted dehydrogenase